MGLERGRQMVQISVFEWVCVPFNTQACGALRTRGQGHGVAGPFYTGCHPKKMEAEVQFLAAKKSPFWCG